jgi:hypothetical protein
VLGVEIFSVFQCLSLGWTIDYGGGMPRILATAFTWYSPFIEICKDTQREVIILEKYPPFKGSDTREC